MLANSTEWLATNLGDVTFESSARLGAAAAGSPVYGVDRATGLTPAPKYVAKDLARYKRLQPGMFAYNPMRLNIGSIGFCSYEHAPGLVSPDYVVFGCDTDRLCPEFLNYYIKSSNWRGWTEGSGVGSVRVRIYFRELARMPISLPPVGEQQAIAHTLGALDDKIELNRRMNETLEQVARALFKSWLVDFDPVCAKAEGRDPGLPSEIADLFPDSFEESELGEIPRGWEVRSLDEIARFVNGLALQKYPPKDGRSLPVIKIAQLRAGSTDGADRASADLDPDYVVDDGDVLFSWSGSLECVLWSGGKGALNQHLFKVTSERFPKWLYYLWIHEHLEEFRHIAAGKATTMGHIQRYHLSDAKVVTPPEYVVEALDGVIGPIIESLWRHRVHSRTLAQVRDALLPELISGELSLSSDKKCESARAM